MDFSPALLGFEKAGKFHSWDWLVIQLTNRIKSMQLDLYSIDGIPVVRSIIPVNFDNDTVDIRYGPSCEPQLGTQTNRKTYYIR